MKVRFFCGYIWLFRGENGQAWFFTKCFARGIRNDDNSRTKCLFDLNFFLCSSEVNAILLVPNKDITHFVERFFYFLVHLWAWAWPVQPLTNFPDLELFFGVSRVHYQLIPSEKHFEFNCSGIFARLTALLGVTCRFLTVDCRDFRHLVRQQFC